jgi:hypothetical protein
MRTVTTLLMSLAMALAAIGLAVAAPGRGDPAVARAALAAASGAVSITNSHAGQAVLGAAAMRPGQTVRGTVQIGNGGDVAGRFAVRVTGVHDTAGPYGGLLSERVDLVLLDVTDAQQPVTMFSGHPADLEQVDLGALAAGEGRDYTFELTLPDGGVPSSDTTGDNRYQGSALSLGFEWVASGAAAATPKPKPGPTSVPKPKPPVIKPVVMADALGLPAASGCVKNGRLKLKLKAPGGAKVVTATITVNGHVKARLKGAKARKPVSLRGLRKTTKLKVTVRASSGRSYTGTRTYRSCGKHR